jgi:hypothetical protein
MMDPTEAAKITQNPDELQDMCDDHLQEPAPEPDLSAELTKDIQRSPPRPSRPKKPRTKAQQEAFAKAQRVLAEKRAKAKEQRDRAAEQAQQLKIKPKKLKSKPKKPREVVYEVEASETESSSEEEVVYVQRRKPKPKKPKQRKPPRVVYVTDSDDEYEAEPPLQQPVEWINFV